MNACLRLVAILATLSLASGCGGGSSGGLHPSVGGTVSGLEGTGLVLQLNGGETVVVNADGPFRFRAALAEGAAYSVAVQAQPEPRLPSGLIRCEVTSGTGTFGTDDVTDVQVGCRTRAIVLGNAGALGWEPWITDGTTEGTRLLQDINRGSPSRPHDLATLGDTVFFWASDGADQELWKSDGTAEGTAVVANINPTGDSDPHYDDRPVAFGGSVYFAADDGEHGAELWRTDGTVTRMVKDIDLVTSWGSEPFAPVVLENEAVGSALLFMANPGGNGWELWKTTDGTEEHTAVVRAIADGGPRLFASSPSWGVLGGHLYFAGSDGTTEGLWSSDGTRDGTLPIDVTDEAGGSESSVTSPRDLIVFGGSLYFWDLDAGDEELWAFTPASGTGRRIVTVGGNSVCQRDMAISGDALYFVACSVEGRGELWKLTGPAAEPTRVEDFAELGITRLEELVAFGDALYFRAFDGTTWDLWRTRGTDGTTEKLSSAGPYCPTNLTVFGGSLHFAAYGDGCQVGANALWKTDGTEITLVQDPAGAAIRNVDTGRFAATGDELFFAANDGVHGTELWRTGAGGTHMVVDLNTAGSSRLPGNAHSTASLGGWVYFAASDGAHGSELWRTNGEGETVMVDDIDPRWTAEASSSSNPYGFVASGDLVYFVASDGDHGYELWRTDGTGSGTRIVVDDINNEGSSSPKELTSFGGRLHFTAVDASGDRDLWRTDGTDPGTTRLRSDDPTFPRAPFGLTVFQGDLYFCTHAPIVALWRYDGSASPTMLKEFQDDWDYQGPQLTVAGDRLFFRASDGANGTGLWRTDGTAAGTAKVRDVVPGASGYPTNLVALGGLVFFEADGGLWRSDGTQSGTRSVFDGPLYYYGGRPTAFDGRIYFEAWHGGENYLWTADGDAGSARELVSVGPHASYPGVQPRFVLNGGLYFFAGFQPADSSAPTALWRTDGTESSLVKDFAAGPAGEAP